MFMSLYTYVKTPFNISSLSKTLMLLWNGGYFPVSSRKYIFHKKGISDLEDGPDRPFGSSASSLHPYRLLRCKSNN